MAATGRGTPLAPGLDDKPRAPTGQVSTRGRGSGIRQPLRRQGVAGAAPGAAPPGIPETLTERRRGGGRQATCAGGADPETAGAPDAVPNPTVTRGAARSAPAVEKPARALTGRPCPPARPQLHAGLAEACVPLRAGPHPLAAARSARETPHRRCGRRKGGPAAVTVPQPAPTG